MSRRTLDQDARGAAIRALLASPLLLRRRDEELFRDVAAHRTELAQWFEHNLGWRLHVDVRDGIARLHKRTGTPDPHRGLRRRRAGKRPFDAFRYQLLALVCAEFLRRQLMTLGDLGDALARICGSDEALRRFNVARHADRSAFVDVLLWLIDVGAVQVTAGDVDGFSTDKDVDAVLVADTKLIPLLLSSDTAPSRIEANTSEEWIRQLTAEPRYGTAATDFENTDREQRNRWARHQVIRRLIDDPAVELEELPEGVREYLFSPSGREKAVSALEEAGLTVERHADVWIGVDPDGESTGATFGSTGVGRASTTEQAAAIVLNHLLGAGADGQRQLLRRSLASLSQVMTEHLDENPGWARAFRSHGGADALLADAIDLLEEFGLVRREDDEVVPRPAAARFTVCIKSESESDDEYELEVVE